MNDLFYEGDIIQCINADRLPGNDYGPKLKKGDSYEVKKIILDSKGNQHLDIGLPSMLSYISSYETKEKLTDGDKIHWCHPSRFKVVASKR